MWKQRQLFFPSFDLLFTISERGGGCVWVFFCVCVGFGVFLCVCLVSWGGYIFLNKFGLIPTSLEIQQGRVETGLRILRLLSSIKVSVGEHLFW